MRPDPSTRRLLLVDDETAILRMVGRLLERFGWDVTTAATVQTAVAELRESPFTAVLCDLTMPGEGGAALCDYIAEHMPHLRERVILASGDLTSSEAKAVIQRTGCASLQKPYDLDTLLAALAATDPAAGAHERAPAHRVSTSL